MPAEDYVGPVGHEKKFHKTHFGGVELSKKPLRQRLLESGWVEVSTGRWKPKPIETRDARRNSAEVTND